MNIITLLIGLLALGGLAALYAELRLKMHFLADRVKKLEDASQKRIPYKVAEELLDAMAALDIERSHKQLDLDILDNAVGHVANALKVGTKREGQP